jgi:hypothetical protein
MAQPQRDWVGVFVIFGALAVLLVAALCRPPGPERGSAARGQSALDARRHNDQIDARMSAVQKRMAEKAVVARAVIRGELTLWQAAEQFREICAADPWALQRLRDLHPRVPDSELWCRNVIAHIRGILVDDPAPDVALPARLEAELAATTGHASESPRLALGH